MARVSPSGPLKPAKGRGCPVLLTWGDQAQPPHLPPWEESQEQWAVEGWFQRWPAGSQAKGWGRGGSMPSPKPAESPSRELTVARVPLGGPGY